MKKNSMLFLVLSVFLLVGCGKKVEQKVTKENISIQPSTHVYKEKKLVLPNEVNKIIHTEKIKGKIYVSALNHSQQSVIYTIDESGNFHEELLISSLVSEPIQFTFLGKNGDLVIVPREDAKEEETKYIYTTTIDNPKKIQRRDAILGHDERIQVVNQEVCIVSSPFGETKIIDLVKGTEEIIKSEGNISSITNDGKKIYTQISNKIQVISKENKKIETMTNLSSVLGGINPLITIEDEQLYLYEHQKLYLLKDEKLQELLSMNEYSLGKNRYKIEKFIPQNEQFVVVVTDTKNDSSDISLLTPTEQEKKVISLYSLYENPALSEIIAEYNTKQSDVLVRLTVGANEQYEGDTIYNVEQAMKNLNLELANSNPYDMIILDGLNSESYIKNDLLLPLTEPQDMNFKNLFTHFQKEGKNYGSPTFFNVPYIAVKGVQEINVENINDLTSYIKNIKKEHLYENVRYDFVVKNIYRSYFPTELKNIKESDVLQFNKDVLAITKRTKDLEKALKIKNLTWNNNVIGGSYNSYDLLLNGEFNLAIDQISLAQDIQCLVALEKENKANVEFLDNTYLPVLTFSIFKESQNKEESQRFISFTQTKEAQELFDYAGLPTNQESFEGKLRELETEVKEISSEYGNEGKANLEKLSSEDVSIWIEKVKKLDHVPNLDIQMMQIVMEGLEDILQDKGKVNEVSAKVYEKLKLYLEE
ncbi:hypothetical protein RyT2_07010 [Pseudolactococcus yaeyamensis]